jgi:hypothetical protein
MHHHQRRETGKLFGRRCTAQCHVYLQMHIRGINYEKSAKGNDEQGQPINISGDVFLLFGFFFFPLFLFY